MRSIALKANKRDQVGPKAAKQLRKTGEIPCVVYGGSAPVHFSLDQNTVNKIVYTPDFSRIDLELDGKVHPSIIKEIQFGKMDDKVQHIDFLELVEDKKIICDIPIKLMGVAKGVREGGKLLVKVRKLKVKAFPKDLKDTIELNVETLELGKSVKVSDVKVENLEILNSMSIPIASVEVTRALKSAATEAAKADKKK